MSSKAQQIILTAFTAELSEDHTRGRLTLRGTKSELIEVFLSAAQLATLAGAFAELSSAARPPHSAPECAAASA
jgi:hypothetical protein